MTRTTKTLGSLALAVALAAGTSAAANPATASPYAGGTASGTTAATDVSQGVTHAQNPLVPAGASWTEHYFASAQAGSPTAVQLHADVLRPAHLPANKKTPVIVSVGPYFSHAGQTGVERTDTGPSERFNDLINGAELMAKGYTVVLVDLRGYGGSTGCLDWLGRGEQADITAAVEWAATQRWSTGKVGTYGKSYDASTGVWANNLQPRGLAAVVAQEPLWNGYNYYYSNGVARYNYVGTPNAYNEIAQIPATAGDTAQYKANAAYEAAHPECMARNSAVGLFSDPADAVWRERDAIGSSVGSTTPMLFTQGLTESNTKPEQMQEFLTNHNGTERGWMGPWEHVRGNDVYSEGVLAMGRSGWFDEVVRFYDEHLKGIKPTVKDPSFAIQNSDGVWRAQSSWPQVGASGTVKLGRGSYVDDGQNSMGTLVARTGDMDQQVQVTKSTDATTRISPRLGASEAGTSAPSARSAASAANYFVFSKPVRAATRITATPRVTLKTQGAGTVQVRLFDVDPASGVGIKINENVANLTGTSTSFDLKSLDWDLAPGHVLAVQIGSVTTDEYWLPANSGRTVTVTGGTLTLQTARTTTDVATQGVKSAFLDDYKETNAMSFTSVPAGTFTLPKP